ncbi:MAG: hypothetical protein C0596_14905 [Marinilabiliales bacterium]|nr:MAG: hypothetical protein C0596_14905 [Marinilabiliales bacterium]
MKKTFKIILGVLFAISAVFIFTGALLVENKFYINNNTGEEIKVKVESKSGEVYEFVVPDGSTQELYSKKVFQLNNDSEKFKELIINVHCVKSDDAILVNKPDWEISTDHRNNTYILEVNSENW